MKNKIFLFIMLLLLVVTGCSAQEGENKYMTGKHHVVISVENYGDISVELDADVAPITVTNFINLANNNFYDGTKFHRIIEGFMIQGGGSTTKEATNIKGEFASNGVQNSIKHVRGVISMARATDPNSATSQFFIMHEDAPHLDGDYAAFGHVTSGMDVVDKIATTPKPIDGNGTILEQDQPVIKNIKVID